MSVNVTSQPGNNGIKPDAPVVSPSNAATAIAGTLSSTAGGASVAFTPSVNPGKGTASYIATSNPGGFTASANSSPITFASGVFNRGTSYTFTIVKQSGSGINSDASVTSNAITAFTIPGAPGITLATGDAYGAGVVGVSYSAPANNGGSAITSYQYSTNGGASWTTTPSNPFNISGLGNGTSVTVTMRAVNAAGNGDTASSSATTPNVPSAPTSLTIADTSTSTDWSWAAPSSNGGLSITSYQYQVAQNDGSFPHAENSVYRDTLTNSATWLAYPSNILRPSPPNTNYYKLRVRACNGAGCGAWATSANSTAWYVESIGSNYSADAQEEGVYTSSGCPSTCCNTCGNQPRHRTKVRYRTYATHTWRWGSSETRYTEERLMADYPDWASVSTYNPCVNNGGCSTTSRTTYNAAYDGQVLSTACGYRTWSSYFGAWAASDSAGNFNWPNGYTSSGCGSQQCYVFSTSITYCSDSACSAQYECEELLTQGSCCGFLGCYPTTACS